MTLTISVLTEPLAFGKISICFRWSEFTFNLALLMPKSLWKSWEFNTNSLVYLSKITKQISRIYCEPAPPYKFLK